MAGYLEKLTADMKAAMKAREQDKGGRMYTRYRDRSMSIWCKRAQHCICHTCMYAYVLGAMSIGIEIMRSQAHQHIHALRK